MKRPLAAALMSLFVASASADPPEELSQEARDAVASVHRAMELAREGCEQQGAAGVAEKLVCLGRLDQAGRSAFQTLDLSALPPGQPEAASAAVWREINEQDLSDQAALVALMPETGWFTRSAYGHDASEAAWRVVQHATENLPLMQTALERMSSEIADVGGDDYGMLSDRVRMLEGRPQVYGSQFKCVDHRWVRYRMEDPETVDQRRAAIGMTETEQQVLEKIDSFPPCYFR